MKEINLDSFTDTVKKSAIPKKDVKPMSLTERLNSFLNNFGEQRWECFEKEILKDGSWLFIFKCQNY